MYTSPRKLSNWGLYLFLFFTCTCNKHEPKPSKKTIQRHDTTYRKYNNFMRPKLTTWPNNLNNIVTNTVRFQFHKHITTLNLEQLNNNTDQSDHTNNNTWLETSQQQYLTWHRSINYNMIWNRWFKPQCLHPVNTTSKHIQTQYPGYCPKHAYKTGASFLTRSP